MRILTRYVLAELAKWFLVSLTALTLILIVFGVVREAINQNLPPAQVLQLIPFILPDALRMSVPGTLLLATTSVFGRMSGSNEIVAIKALGISPTTVLWPMWTLAFLLSLVTVWLNDLAVSWGRTGAQRVVVESVEEIAYSMLRSQRRYSSPRFSINVRAVEGRKLISPTMTVQTADNAPQITITAAEAELRTDRGADVLKVILRNGSIDVENRVSVRFPDTYEQDIPLKDASRDAEDALPPSWLSLRAIRGETPRQMEAIRRFEQRLALRASCQMLSGDFEGLTSREWETRARQLTGKYQRLYRLRTEPQRRWSAGFSCLCFAWVGAPMAIRLRNRDFLTSFFLCFLPILVVYYPLLAYGVDASKSGTLPPLCVWAGNVLLLGWGTWLLRKVVRY